MSQYTQTLVIVGTDAFYNALLKASQRTLARNTFDDPAYTYEDLANDVFIKTFPSKGKVISLSGCNVLVHRYLIDKIRVKSYKFINHNIEINENTLTYTMDDDAPEIDDSNLFQKVDYYLHHGRNCNATRKHFARFGTDMLPDDVASLVQQCL